jgi:adenine-specific DNA-methyltransferase
LALVTHQKASGAYFTPPAVAQALVSWVARESGDRLLDPSCGDGRFLAAHASAVGVEQDPRSAADAMENAPHALIHQGDFFSWASETSERFECLAGNPPFIRYQRFAGETRQRALDLCRSLGASFSGLASSWAPFLVAASSLLKPGGRMAFVVPAEIGHAPYAAPLLEHLVGRFAHVQVVAVRDKLFPDLSEDCWLLYAEGYGGANSAIGLSVCDHYAPSGRPPRVDQIVPVSEWRSLWGRRLRPYLLNAAARDIYAEVSVDPAVTRLGDLAQVGIGYVSGANDFFHLSPSEAERWDIPATLLQPSVRKGSALPASVLSQSTVEDWRRRDEAFLLLRLRRGQDVPRSVRRYLDSAPGHEARQAYKCRTRDPWYAVPDVHVPDYFLSYMSGRAPSLVRNGATATCTNSVHAVRLRPGVKSRALNAWGSPFVQLSCEIAGHPLGGGMLKLEPTEAANVLLPGAAVLKRLDRETVTQALTTIRAWRHHADAA